MNELSDTALVKSEPQSTALATAQDLNLSDEEALFCELYANGGPLYAGNPTKCYSEAFGETGAKALVAAKAMLQRDEIQTYLSIVDVPIPNESEHVKKFLAGTLMGIIEETATSEYTDRFGTVQSVAPLRAVAVSAAKTLADLYSLRQLPSSKAVDDDGERHEAKGVTFNVIVPVANAVQEQPVIEIK